MKTAYRLWVWNDGLRCDGFYEVHTLDELFETLEHFKQYGRIKGYRAYARIEQTMIDHDCEICSSKSTDIAYTIDLGIAI